MLFFGRIKEWFKNESDQEPIFTQYFDERRYIIEIKTKKIKDSRAMSCFLYRDCATIKIGDIYVSDKKGGHNYRYLRFVNKGYGTKMMNMLIDFAQKNGYKKIIGSLVDGDKSDNVDTTHRERQIHFYKKFGFKILPDENDPHSIELILEAKEKR